MIDVMIVLCKSPYFSVMGLVLFNLSPSANRARSEGWEQLGRWHRQSVSIGAVNGVVWWEGTEWRAGEVQYMAEEQSWEDLVEVAKCLPETNNLTGFDKVPAVSGCHFP